MAKCQACQPLQDARTVLYQCQADKLSIFKHIFQACRLEDDTAQGEIMATQTAVANNVSQQEAYEIASQAYWYFYPLLSMDVTRRQTTNLPAGQKPGFGPINAFSHIRAYPDAEFKTVVRPNFDTLYSSAWLDLSEEPMVISAPDTKGRYYLLPMLDMWTDVFAVPGWRTSGTQPQNYAVVAPGWTGTLPEGVGRIDATTSHVWIIGRIKTDGPDDYKDVHSIQDALLVTPLSLWGKAPQAVTAKIDSSVDMKTPPLEQVNRMTAQEYFARAAELLAVYHPHSTDWSLIARLRRIGIEAGKNFDLGKFDSSVAQEINKATKDALQAMVAKVNSTGTPVNGWAMNTDSMGVYGNFYFKRAIVAMVGLGANQPEDAIYPLNFADADGQAMTGDKNYVMHFDAKEMPPVNAFWSLTMYDADGFQTANELNRFAISSWMPLKKNSDGSLDLYIQHKNPGADKESNWLPSPNSGKLGVTMRLYAPKQSALNGDWAPPPIRKSEIV